MLIKLEPLKNNVRDSHAQFGGYDVAYHKMTVCNFTQFVYMSLTTAVCYISLGEGRNRLDVM